MEVFDKDIEQKISDLKGWLEANENANICDIQFCPRELTNGHKEDYIADVHNMIRDFKQEKYTDITSVIL